MSAIGTELCEMPEPRAACPPMGCRITVSSFRFHRDAA
ncbi:hypothetical protein OEM_08190 [Mycobacterium intracellulare subsp. yongonense 05-1390]|nr:hypothetical protein OEM_08190 [Mycobacterium intracellulare subsp. yongonense 05-1390]ARR76491.1 hypothetical protein MOTT12_00827 [Mycobacterium intracellulare subsp. yongonense]ARR81638.1 hypothetical protein MOTT27_00817 [Mycobacterium intracellulare subsp. yongonense]